MRHSRLPADFHHRLRDLLSTVHGAQALLRSERDDDRLRRVLRLAVRQTRAGAGVMLLVSEDRGDLIVAATAGAAPETALGVHVPRTGLAGFAMDDGNPVAVARLAGAAPGADGDDLEPLLGAAHSRLAVPLLVHGRAAGAIELRDAPDPRGFGPDDLELAVELAHLAAAAVEEHRGERLLMSLFAAALPAALDAERGDGAAALREELAGWVGELRQSPAWRRDVELVAQVRELIDAGADAVALARGILDAILARERKRRAEAAGQGGELA